MRVAIVEDEQQAYELLNKYLGDYGKENAVTFDIARFVSSEQFLAVAKGKFDIVFMDIELPGMNGMDASQKLREFDENMALIFVTNMAQYAVKGYEVQALDFLVKPVSYASFSMKLKRAMHHVEKRQDRYLTVSMKNGVRRLLISKIEYIEVSGHHLYFHFEDEVIDACGSLSKIEKEIGSDSFSRCNNCYLVNLNYVTSISSKDVVVGNDILLISRTKRKQFTDDFIRCIGE